MAKLRQLFYISDLRASTLLTSTPTFTNSVVSLSYLQSINIIPPFQQITSHTKTPQHSHHRPTLKTHRIICTATNITHNPTNTKKTTQPAMSYTYNTHTHNPLSTSSSSSSSSSRPRTSRFREEMNMSTDRCSVLENPRRAQPSRRTPGFDDFVPRHQLNTMNELDRREKEKQERSLNEKAKKKLKERLSFGRK
ncbi:hypothetical protein CC86DRAFT_182186 [Ophiobolus disseminans]|uniref:Uncharacterized protein n=1 Tax=Ophiobolus disseminans TaxID=1469910 RepID=A0A6A7ABW6_9PLEO|nr:hypothetical protein CC86DRAFT_182186 [Ophiobolus disseminans]